MSYGFAAGFLLGAATLAGLTTWQCIRGWDRQERIHIAAERLAATPVPLPPVPGRTLHTSLPVEIRGRFDHPAEQRIFAARPEWGIGARLVTPFDLEPGRRILVDRGFLPDSLPESQTPEELRPPGTTVITGALAWPRERGIFTPEPEPDLWFARDVPALAAATGAEPVLVIAWPTGARAWPHADPPALDRTNIHVGYALTWAGLLIAWLVIGGLLARQNRRPAGPG